MAASFDVDAVRAHFPALHQDKQVYFDNAGGSQVLGTVASSVKDYLEQTNVQLGASYNTSKQSSELYQKGLEAAAEFIGADVDEVVIGPSTTQLFANLSQILPPFPPHSEILLSRLDHEANLASWVRLATHNPNVTLKWFPDLPPPTGSNTHPSSTTPHDTSPLLTPTTLLPHLTPNTRLVALTHCSNILGSIHPIRLLSDTIHAHSPNALVVVDGVALAPHRPVDVKELGCDVYAFSWYKCYGPHVATLYVSRAAQQAGMGSLGHFFHGRESLSQRLELAGGSYELVSALPRVVEYFKSKRMGRGGWEGVREHEVRLQETLLRYLRGRKGVTVWGMREGGDGGVRVPVVSFSVEGRGARGLVEAVERKTARVGGRQFGIRWGHFYSKRLVEEYLRVEGGEGVVRVSLVHYNTVEEVEAFVGVLDGALREGEEVEERERLCRDVYGGER